MGDAAEDILGREIDVDEQLLWSGKPRQGVIFRPFDALIIPFSVIWGGFAVFWECSVILQPAPAFLPLFGIPFVLMGFYLVFGRFLADSWLRSRTFLGVTDRRVLIATHWFTERTRSLPLDGIGQIDLSEWANGGGTIAFGPYPANYYFQRQFYWVLEGSLQKPVPNFELATDARKVYDVIRNAQRSMTQA